MDNSRIVSVEWGVLEGQRPRHAGCNARLGEHGLTVQTPLARLTTGEGHSGFGFCRADQQQAAALLGKPVSELITVAEGVSAPALAFDYPLWDLLGQQNRATGLCFGRCLGRGSGKRGPLSGAVL